MKRVFLYLYPIEKYQRVLMCSDKYYENHDLENPIIVMNECIKKRYKDNGYEVLIANYPDEKVYGISSDNIDRIINVDVIFSEASGYREDGSEKPLEEVKYPSEKYLFEQIGEIDEIVIGGFHEADCVRRVAEYFLKNGVDTMVDLELTDFLYHLYKQPYFNREKYNPANYKQYNIALGLKYGENMEFISKQLEKKYSSSVYKFNEYEPTISVEEILESTKNRFNK